jgi:hypothetical protein
MPVRSRHSVDRFPLHLKEHCPPRQQSRAECLKAKVEPLLTQVTVENPEPEPRLVGFSLNATSQPRVSCLLEGVIDSVAVLTRVDRLFSGLTDFSI